MPQRKQTPPAASSRRRRTPATVASLLVDYLKSEGVDCVFGIPGGPATPLFDALHGQSAIRTIATRHEAGAAFMAAGYARTSGRLGVCLLTTGPGTTNAVTAIAAAKADSLPVLCISAQVATAAFGKGSLQDSTALGAGTVEVMRPVTKASWMLANAHNLPTALREAVRTAWAGRPGPVHLNIPTDLMKRAIAADFQLPQFYRAAARVFDREAVKAAAQALLSARRPAVLAGHGANLSAAGAQLRELAELLELPVATTPKGKGAFPEDHALSLGVFGQASSPRAESYLTCGKTDVLFVIGSGLHEISTQGWESSLAPTEALLQLDIDARAIGRNYPVQVALVGDAKTTLRELVFHLKRLLAGGEFYPRRGGRAFAAWKRGVAAFADERAAADESLPLKPQRLVRELDAVLPDDAIVFLDVGNHALWGLHYLVARGRRVFVHNWGEFAAMGFGVAGAVGGKLGALRRPVVAIGGDGGFAMCGMEVLTAVTYDIPVVWVIFNDGRFNTVHHGQTMQYAGRTIGTEFSRIDVAGVARALGARAYEVSEPGAAGPALRDALASDRPCVIDVRIDRDEVPPIHARVRSLERFFAAAEQADICPF